MFNKTWGLFFALMTSMGGGSLLAAPEVSSSPASQKLSYDIAVVNIEKLLYECKAAKQVQEELETQRLKFQEEMKAQEESFLKWDKTLVEQQKKLKPQELLEKRKEFDTRLAQAQKEVSERRERLESSLNQAMTKIQETILLLIRDAAVKYHCKLVIPKNFIVFREDGLEITDEILKILDEKLPSVSLKFSSHD